MGALRLLFELDDRTPGQVSSAEGRIKAFATRLGDVGKKMTAAVTLPIVAAGAAILKWGSDAQEAAGKFDIVFGELGGRVSAALDTFAAATNRSSFELKDMAGRFGDLLKPLGFTGQGMADLTVDLVKLAVDLSSFNNMPMDEALRRLQGTLVGSHENALAFGVVINENTLKAEMAANGTDKLTGAMFEQAKVQARINLLMRGTVDAQGDAIRTAGSFANQMKGLAAAFKDTGIAIANSGLLDFATAMVKDIANWVRGIGDLNPQLLKWGTIIAGVVAVIGPLLVALGAIVAIAPSIATAVSIMFGPWGILAAVIVTATVVIVRALGKQKAALRGIEEASRTARQAIAGMNREQLAATKIKLVERYHKEVEILKELEAQLKKQEKVLKGTVGREVEILAIGEKIERAKKEKLATNQELIDIGIRGNKITKDTIKAEEEREKELKKVRATLAAVGGAETKLQKIVEGTAVALRESAAAYAVVGGEAEHLERNVGILEGALITLSGEGKKGSEQWNKYQKELTANKVALTGLAEEKRKIKKRLDDIHKKLIETTPELKKLGDAAELTSKKIEQSFGGRLLGVLGNVSLAFERMSLGEALERELEVGIARMTTSLQGFGGMAQRLFSSQGPWGVALSAGLGVLQEFGVDVEAFFGKMFESLGKSFKAVAKLIFGDGGKSPAQELREGEAAIASEIFKELGDALREIEAIAIVFGTTLEDQLADKIRVTEDAIVALIRAGLDPSHQAIVNLTSSLKDLEQQAIEATKVIEPVWRDFVDKEQVEKLRNQIHDLSNEIDSAVVTYGANSSEVAALNAELVRLQAEMDALRQAGEAAAGALAPVAEEVTKIGEGLGTVIPTFEGMVDVLLNSTIPALEAEAEVAKALGLEFDLTGKKQEAYRKIIEELAKELGLSHPIVQDLIGQYKALGGAFEVSTALIDAATDTVRGHAEMIRQVSDEEQVLIDKIKEELRLKEILIGIEDFILDRTRRITAEFGQFADGAAQASDMIRLLNEAMVRMREEGLQGTDAFNELSAQLEEWQSRLAAITEEAKRAADRTPAKGGTVEVDVGDGKTETIRVGDIKVNIDFPRRIEVALVSLSENVRRMLSQPLLDMVSLWTGSPTASGLVASPAAALAASFVMPAVPQMNFTAARQGPQMSAGALRNQAGYTGPVTIQVFLDRRKIAEGITPEIARVIQLRIGSGPS